ncbi:MAG: GFA family protein [Rhodobiaceae bacterium]|nr:GFA family protein [Rhodobiaceae bacterium]MCC0053915.1 GFA family protein [Rhodobiaceae bacterium]
MKTEIGTSSDVLTGRCACGAVAFSARGPFRPFVGCHCDSCRRQTGHFVVATRVAADGLSIEGEENLKDWRASDGAARRFCSTCGSLMFWVPDGRGTASIMAGSIDKPTNLPLGWHIFSTEKGDYYDLDDGTPVYPYSSGI